MSDVGLSASAAAGRREALPTVGHVLPSWLSDATTDATMTAPRLPHPVPFLLRHAGLGFAVAAATVAAIILLDPGGLGALLSDTAHHPGPAVLLWFFLGLTFGSAQIAFAVMLLAEGETDGPRGGTPARLQPIPVRVRR